MKKILVVNVNWLGDVIFSSPVFKALKENYPDATISCLAVPRVKEMLESIQYIDEIILYDEKGKHRGLFGKLSLISRLKKENFDAAFLLHKSLTRALIIFLAGIPIRVGYDTKARGIFFTHKIKDVENTIHRCDYYLKAIEFFGVKVNDRTTRLLISTEPDQKVDELLESYGLDKNDDIFIINPGGNWNLKRWPIKNYRQLIMRINEEFNAKIIINGAQKDIELAEKIAEGLNTRPIIIAGQTNLKELIALMNRARIVISGDSGPLHIASSIGTSTIGLFGPTSVKVTGPRGVGKSIILTQDVGCNRKPCYFLDCIDNVCIQAITVENVISAIRQIKSK